MASLLYLFSKNKNYTLLGIVLDMLIVLAIVLSRLD